MSDYEGCPFCIAFEGACAVCEEDEYDAEQRAGEETPYAEVPEGGLGGLAERERKALGGGK